MNNMKLTPYFLLGLSWLAVASCGNDWLDLEPSTAV